MRRVFFGPDGDTSSQRRILSRFSNYIHKNIDVRGRVDVGTVFKEYPFDVVIHAAAQPSHDKAKEIPILDFEVNALGTLNLLEQTRTWARGAVFIYTSTNKVYGDHPNALQLKSKKEKFEPKNPRFKGFGEGCPIDNCVHSLMGTSKLAADLYVQEYGKNLGLKTTALRLGCVTGSFHSSVQAHGFLSFLVKSLVRTNSYSVIGYGGRQVRDQIHADGVAFAFEEIIKRPARGEVFNLGGGRENSASVLELLRMVSDKLGVSPNITHVKTPRVGDHKYYVTDYSKFQSFYPGWHITKNLSTIIDEIIHHELRRGPKT